MIVFASLADARLCNVANKAESQSTRMTREEHVAYLMALMSGVGMVQLKLQDAPLDEGLQGALQILILEAVAARQAVLGH